MKILRKSIAFIGLALFNTSVTAADWGISGTLLTPDGIVADNTMSISDGKVLSIDPTGSARAAVNAVPVSGIILPGFIDLHDHLTWNIQPRWLPGRKFNNRYEWQDTAEYDRVLNNPHYAELPTVFCEAEIYAEIKALAGGATSALGGLLNSPCTAGLVRNLDTDSGLPKPTPPSTTACPTQNGTDRTLLDVVDNEVFPLEVQRDRFSYLLCALSAGSLPGLVVHLAEGANTDSAAHREYSMLSKEILLTGKDGKTPVVREGLALIHGTALRDPDFAGMKNSKVGLIWSPRSNDELYGSTTNIASARLAKVDIAIAPDWSPSGSAGMLQELGYASRHYGMASSDLVAMATVVPARIVRISDFVGALAPGKYADFVVVNTSVDLTSANPLDPIVKATPANISLVVVNGTPIYGDEALLQRILPGKQLDTIKVCGAKKAVDLSGTAALANGWKLDTIKDHLFKALESVGSSLAEVECD
jgi:5-methylthioadenosine/S-adenosylhomocysteine deaminase